MLSLRRLCAAIIGLVFAFSSVFKLMDPVGTGLIVEGYLQFLHIDFLRPSATFIGEMLSLLEAALCVALITGVWQKITAIATLSMLGFFTVISILLVIFNPDMSCGCFGKVLELTHVQTLIKNVVLSLLSVIAFFPFGQLGAGRADRYVSFAISFGAIFIFALYSLIRIPVLDYTEFAPSHTIVPETREGYEGFEYPTLPIWDDDGQYCSDVLLQDRVIAISVPRPEDLSNKGIHKIVVLSQAAYNSGWTPVVLSAGNLDIPGVDVYMADYKKLMTFNRSNGGAVLLEDGYIIKKYARGGYPSFDDLDKMCQEDAVEIYVDSSTRHSLALQGFFLAILAVMLFV